MKATYRQALLAAALTGTLAFTATAQAADKPKMSTPIPPDITTPDSVQTRLGTLKFFDGLPDKATVEKVYDNLDFTRGVDVFLNTMAAASTLANIEGLKSVGCDNYAAVIPYDTQTRSVLQTDQRDTALTSESGTVKANADGSVDIYFGPKSPAGKESNWIQTVPGKGWFTILRLYGALEPWFDKTWQPGEIVLVK